MLWNWNTVDTCFIARSWHITSRGMFAGSCIGVICLVICLEFLRRLGKEYDRLLLRQHKSKVAATETNQASSAKVPSFGFRPTVFQQMVRALLHMCQFAVAYFVMLWVFYTPLPVWHSMTNFWWVLRCITMGTSLSVSSLVHILARLSLRGRPLVLGE